MKLKIFIFCFLLTNSLTAQTIQGTVTDEISQEGLPFANVILEQNNVQKAGTTTDLDGNYILTGFDPGTYDVRVGYVGYQDKLISGITVSSSKTIPLDIQMTVPKDGGVDLSEIVVVNYRIPLIEHDMTSSGSVVTAQEIRKMPVKSATSVIARVAGVGQSKKGKGISFRGVRESDDIIFVDGVKTRRSDIFGKTEPDWNNEEYATITENSFKEVIADPLSTFSIDVDKAAYSNVRRHLTAGQRPPVDAVRVEEMINYFDYDYPQPTGEHPFSIFTEVGDCPWNPANKLVLIGLKGKEIDISNAPASNLVFLIDVSGSMGSQDKLPLVKKSLKMLVENLSAQDRIAIVTYAGYEALALPSTPGDQEATIIQAIDLLGAGGSTAGGAGIMKAYEIGKQHFIKDGNNRIILATDGDFNVGVSNDNQLKKLIETKRKSGIYLTVLGYGTGNYKDSKMETLADYGNGNYAYIDNIREAKKVLVNEMSGTLFTIAKDVKIQVEFNPAQVDQYLLIGYENRLLNKEDFNNNKKDAGEIGAGHTVTALYEIIPAKSKDNTLATATVDPLLYQSSTLTSLANESSELMQLKLRYKLPKSRTSILLQQPVNLPATELQTSEHFRFAAAVASFGKLLRQSKQRKKLNIKEIKTLAASAIGKDPYGYRQEFVRLLDLYKR